MGGSYFLNCYHGLCYNTLLFQTKIWTFMTQHRPSYFADLKNFDVNEFTVIVTCADGLEAALQIELNSFGLSSDVLRAGRVAVVHRPDARLPLDPVLVAPSRYAAGVGGL